MPVYWCARAVIRAGTSAATRRISTRPTRSWSACRKAAGRGCACSYRRTSPNGTRTTSTSAARPAAAAAIPSLCYTHDLWEHTAKECIGEQLRGKWLIPRQEALNKPILLVARDPRDTIVSLFFHLKKRSGTFAGELPDILRHPVFGIERVVSVMNRWLLEWSGTSRLHVLRYEDARRDPVATFAEALRFLRPTLALDLAAMSRAVEISSFENMRRLEAGTAGGTGTELVQALNQSKKNSLRPANVADPDSYKVRRGKVGGYTDYLGETDIRYLDRVLEKLDPRYGYGVHAKA